MACCAAPFFLGPRRCTALAYTHRPVSNGNLNVSTPPLVMELVIVIALALLSVPTPQT